MTTSEFPGGSTASHPLVPRVRSSVDAARVRRSWVFVLTTVAVIGDLVCASFAFDIARGLRANHRNLPALVASASDVQVSYSSLSIMAITLWIAALSFTGAYRTHRINRLWTQCGTALRSVTVLLAALGIGSMFVQLQPSRSYVVAAVVALPSLWLAWRMFLNALTGGLTFVGIGTERVLLVGAIDTNADIKRHLNRTSARRTRVVAEHAGVSDLASSTPSVLRAELIEDLERHIERHGVTSVIITDSNRVPEGTVRTLSSSLRQRSVSVVLMPSSPEAVSPAVDLHPIGDLMLLRVSSGQNGMVERMARTLVESLLALVTLIVLSPMLIVVVVLVKRTGGPIFFRQHRIGFGGEPFPMYKFRTMQPDAEARLRAEPDLYKQYVDNGYKLPADEDPRITPIGRTLRRTSLDEIPQLWNVARGHMSFVGPRPVLAPELELYGELTDAYTGVKPGLTGYWQINGRSDVGFPERAELDAYYFDHRNLKLDLRILLRTAITLASRKGAH